MPLDTGLVAEFDRIVTAARRGAGPGQRAPALDRTLSLGQALRVLREEAGLTVADIALATRVRPVHVEAIERLDLEALPSRPFTVGYVRAYANLLGVDEAEALGRLRTEAPEEDTALRAPGGMSTAAPRRFGWLAAWALFAMLALAGWNVSRHTAADHRRGPPRVAARPAIGMRAADLGPTHLGLPLPAPPEAATPAVYETPGLAAAAGGGQAKGDVDSHTGAAAAPTAAPTPPGAPFVATAAVYGPAAPASGIVFQARRATPLVVRGAGGAVYFARQLSAGEAWRAPTTPGLIVDVGNPASVEVFVAGFSRGVLSEAQTPVNHFAP
jgi:transcriptional regulator with XRE-family HTH domain